MSPARAALIRELKPFQGRAEGDWFIARTGYTGEDGLEIMLPAAEAPGFLNELVGAGISPAGLEVRAIRCAWRPGSISTARTWTKAFPRLPPTWAGP